MFIFAIDNDYKRPELARIVDLFLKLNKYLFGPITDKLPHHVQNMFHINICSRCLLVTSNFLIRVTAKGFQVEYIDFYGSGSETQM